MSLWDEDRTPFRSLLYLDATTYHPTLLFDIPPCTTDKNGPYLVSPGGHFAYRNRVLPANTGLPLMSGDRVGMVIWNQDIVIPMLLDMHEEHGTGNAMPESLSEEVRTKRGAVWMSLTPMEMMTQRSGVQAASGTVIVGGLGMGWFLRKVCEKPEVEKVIVVEYSRDLLDWYGSDLCSKYDKVTEVICGDVYDQIGKHNGAQYLLDIWPNYYDVQHDRRFQSSETATRRPPGPGRKVMSEKSGQAGRRAVHRGRPFCPRILVAYQRRGRRLAWSPNCKRLD